MSKPRDENYGEDRRSEAAGNVSMRCAGQEDADADEQGISNRPGDEDDEDEFDDEDDEETEDEEEETETD